MAQQLKKLQYRQRIYQGSDGTITLVYGSDPIPVNIDGTEMSLLADHDVAELVTVTDHVSS